MFHWLRNIFARKSHARFDAPSLLATWFAKASASGKPRGLKWESYQFTGEPVFVRDGLRTLALMPVQVQFDPLPDGGFEDIPQSREPRNIIVMFVQIGRGWDAGQALFNVTVEALMKLNAKRWEKINPRPK